MIPLQLHPAAEREIEAVADDYEQQRPGLGVRFAQELQQSFERIRRFPGLYPVEQEPVRVAPIHRFPYSIFYAERADRILILAVGHQHRAPGFWINRLQSIDPPSEETQA